MNKSEEQARVENECSQSRRGESESEQTQGRKSQRVAYRKTQRRGSNRQYSGGEYDARFHHRTQLLSPWPTAISLAQNQKEGVVMGHEQGIPRVSKTTWGERTALYCYHSKSLQVRDPPRQKLLPIWPQCHVCYIGPSMSRHAWECWRQGRLRHPGPLSFIISGNVFSNSIKS